MALTDKVVIKNLCSWPLYFKRANGPGDIRIPASAESFSQLTFEEVQMQIQLDNKLFTGNDPERPGNHARLYIVDEAQRKELFGLSDDKYDDVVVLNAETVSALLNIRTKKEFNERLQALVTTDAEKKMIAQIAKEVGGDEVSAWKMEAINSLAESVTV